MEAAWHGCIFSPVKLSCRCEINLTMVVLLPSRGNELRNELITLEEGVATWECRNNPQAGGSLCWKQNEGCLKMGYQRKETVETGGSGR